MSYLSTNAITVFPSTRRFDKQVSARLLSEKSLTDLINKLVDTDGFVITPDDETTGNIIFSNPFEFNIHGYYFQTTTANSIIELFSSSTEIYGNIYIDEIGDYKELKGQDVDDYYQGITFYNGDLTDASVASSSGLDIANYSLLLFSREDTNSNWSVPTESRIKFNSGFALGIDGGVIE